MDVKIGQPVIHYVYVGSADLDPRKKAKMFATYEGAVWVDVDGPETGPEVVYGFKAKIDEGGTTLIVPFSEIEPLIVRR